jgi:hypothetical protein
MVTVQRPQRVFSFTDHSKRQPKAPPPGDRLDAQFMQLADAITSTQQALAELRRDDGQLKNKTVTEHHLVDGLLADIKKNLTSELAPFALSVAGASSNAIEAERKAALYAADAERAVQVATTLVNGMAALRELITAKSNANDATEQVTQMLTSEAENWANYSHAQADNAAKARDEAVAWAEYLAGPVVDPAQAPAYIAGSPIGSGLYYQPVQGGVAGLWSAKWWALQAYNLVGAAGQFFLGPWPAGPLPGEQNPSTGQVAPNPIPPGSIYFDTTTGQIMVWDGTAWKQAVGLMSAAAQAHYVYAAAANQQDFSGADLSGQVPVVGDHPSDVHINGVRLVDGLDFSVDTGTDTLHISSQLPAGSIVQWDLLMSPAVPAASMRSWKIKPLTPNGTAQDFLLQYTSGGSTLDANVGASPELIVALDGAMQEPGVDFTAAGNSLHLAVAPLADADLWAVWFEPEVQVR